MWSGVPWTSRLPISPSTQRMKRVLRTFQFRYNLYRVFPVLCISVAACTLLTLYFTKTRNGNMARTSPEKALVRILLPWFR